MPYDADLNRALVVDADKQDQSAYNDGEEATNIRKPTRFTALKRELENLRRRRQHEDERVQVVSAKRTRMEEEQKSTQAKIQEWQQKLSLMDNANEKALLLKKQQLQNAKEMVQQLDTKMTELNSVYNKSRSSLQMQLKEERRVLTIRQRNVMLAELNQNQKENGENPGPDCLKWIDEERWTIISGTVIICNIIAMWVQFCSPEQKFEVLGSIFLLFYQVELVLKLIYFQHRFFIGPCAVVGWNWLDFFIVIGGTAEWLFHAFFSDTGGTSGFSCLRLLRLSRLARLAKVAKMWLMSDLSWTQGPLFQSVMIVAVLFNCIIMGVESEYPKLGILNYLENLLLVLYTFELTVRLKLDGFAFFCGHDWEELFWNYLDTLIVSGGILDMWIMKTIVTVQSMLGAKSLQSGRLGQAVSLMRLSRIARVLRLLEVIKKFPPLYTLVIGIAKAMQGMGWVMILIVGLLYTSALCAVRLANGQIIFVQSLDEEKMEVLAETFQNIPEAIFNLFRVMNADLSGVEKLLSVSPESRYIIMVFMVITNWAVFSILTAVVSDNMNAVTEEQTKEKKKEEEAQKKAAVESLFRRLDDDGNGYINLMEFRTLLKDDVLTEELCSYTKLPKEDLSEVFDLLSRKEKVSKEASISYEQFMRLVIMADTPITARPMMKINKRLSRIAHWLQDNKGNLIVKKPDAKSEGGDKSPDSSPTRRGSGNVDGGMVPGGNGVANGD